jgi:hypothetical protein
VPIAVPLVVGLVVVAAAVGMGLLLRKSPEKEQSVTKNTTTQPSQPASDLPNLPKAGNNAPAPPPSNAPAKPPVKKGPPANAKVGLAVGNLAPEIQGEDADGNVFKLSDYRGKVVVLDFWATW